MASPYDESNFPFRNMPLWPSGAVYLEKDGNARVIIYAKTTPENRMEIIDLGVSLGAPPGQTIDRVGFSIVVNANAREEFVDAVAPFVLAHVEGNVAYTHEHGPEDHHRKR